ncbi:Oligosaccharide translocation protein rft1 [Lithohypha guttulata]|uniref:Oligosaccharide translocation protein rft1 n=1 Tax=Lithohypha guttulata TaxID=1690604 RepID=UPI002DDE0BA2|nr:Oligosaccharide translocation protein rft1 [Lithohypha guttulata]
MASKSAEDTTGTLYLIAIQVVSRGLTFIGNQALLRYVSPGHLGLAVQLEALSTSVLYTARESLRVALQRSPRIAFEKKSRRIAVATSQSAVNAAWLVIVLGVVLGNLFSFLYLYPASTDLLNSPDFKLAFWLYAVATILELLSEPSFVVIQQNSLFKSRARAETSAAVARCISACLTAVITYRRKMPMSVLPFAVGQVLYGLFLSSIYCWTAAVKASSAGFSTLPEKVEATSDILFSRFSRPLLGLAGAFYGQSIFKWLLTQGDTLVLSLFADLSAQGIFALASNYGGLLSRLLFQPMEESSRNVFGRLLANEKLTRTGDSTGKSPDLIDKRKQALQYLSTTLRVYSLAIAIPCITLLPQIFPLLVQTLLGSRSQWNSAQTSALLSAYSYYIPCLAFNGILDAFVTSVATEAELGAQSLMMIGTTMIYLSSAYLGMTVMQLGAVGLVYANILNMLLRIGFSIWFIAGWIRGYLPLKRAKHQRSVFRQFVDNSIPNPSCLLVSALIGAALLAEGNVRLVLGKQENPQTTAKVKLAGLFLDFDLFSLSYFLTCVVLLISSVAITESTFLLEVLEPIVPQRVKAWLTFLFPPRQDSLRTKPNDTKIS